MSIRSIVILLAMTLLGILEIHGQINHKIEGITWLDMDDDGIRSITDINLPQVKVDLFNGQGSMIQFTLSGPDGSYSFNNLPDGAYHLKFEKKQGLMFALKDVGDDNFDSDLSSNGITSQFSLNNTAPLITIDAGFRSSILVQTKAFVHVCEGDSVFISPTISGNNGAVSYSWSHDGSTNSNTAILADSNKLLTLTVSDDWEIPVSKNIFIKVNQGVGSKECADVDLFDSSEIPIDLFVNENNPGPISTTDISDIFLGGGRIISIELLEGTNISSINSSSGGVFINNCSGCRTSSTLTYFNPNNDYLDISNYDYFELTEMNIDQGNVAVSIEVGDDFNLATLSYVIESEGPNTNIIPVFFFEDFEGYDQMDFSKLRTISLNFTSVNESIDILMSSILSCSDDACNTALLDSNDICLSDSVALSPQTDCTDDLIYLWDELGFGKEQIVSPLDTTTYHLTIYDQNGCSAEFASTVNVNQPPQLDFESPEYVCFGDVAGINAVVTGGSPPFTYQWNNADLDSSYIEFQVSMDTTINATVTDSNGCTATAQRIIEVRENPSISLSVTNTLCSQPTGSLRAEISGGTPPYSLEWSNGILNQDSITEIDFGLYTLEVTDSLGCNAVASALVNYLPCAELGNYVWHDINFDGVQDSTDLPLPNVIVVLKNGLNEEIRRDTTDENGIYLFEELEGGDYFVEYIQPMDYYPTHRHAISDETLDSNADTLSFNTNKITLADYEKNHTIDAGWYKKVCIGDQVWNDTNLNNYFDSLDVGLENVLVKLMDCDQNPIDSTVTDTIGNYSFCNLDPGEYSLLFCNHDGLVPVEQNVGDETIDSDINPENSMSDCKSLLSGDSLTICDAGFYNISSIGDYIWHDLNANGIQEQSETPLEGVLLDLFSCDGDLLSSTVTDSAGYYIFDSLTAGSYYLEISPLLNSILSPEQSGLDSLLDSDFSGITNRTSCINLPPGVDRRDIDAGLYYQASLGNYAWLDYDLDGLQGTEEEVVQGLKIFLYSCADELIDSTYSNEDGFYIFDGLIPDSYKIKIEINEMQAVTSINNGDGAFNNDIYKSTLESDCVTLSSSEEYIDLDIGLYNLGKIGNFVWYDENGDGVQGSLEEGVPGISITLLNCNENVVSVTESGVNGEYCFSEIPYGDYTVHFDIPSPYFMVNANEGIDDDLDSDANPISNAIECITISTPIDTTLDAGITTCSMIGGTAWFDAYLLNDVKDPFENGVNGIKVKAYKYINGSWHLAKTGYTGLKPGNYSEDGYWEMCLSPGQYYFQFSNISVIEAVEPNQGNDDNLDSDATHTFGINTTDVINVLPGVHDFSVGIGYRWKNSLKKVPSNISIRESRIFVDDDASTLTIQAISSEENSLTIQNDKVLKYIKQSDHIKLYPNPTTGFINIHIPNSRLESIEFIIYENTGKKIKSIPQNVNMDTNTYSIQVDDLRSGLHHLLVKNKDKVEWLPFIKI